MTSDEELAHQNAILHVAACSIILHFAIIMHEETPKTRFQVSRFSINLFQKSADNYSTISNDGVIAACGASIPQTEQ